VRAHIKMGSQAAAHDQSCLDERIILLHPNNSHKLRTFYARHNRLARARHWVNFSFQSLRHQRIRELKYNYGFTENEIKTYTGLTRTDGRPSRTFDRYDFINPINDEIQIEALTFASKNYFKKLLIHQDW
jgi:hypothetical protein